MKSHFFTHLFATDAVYTYNCTKFIETRYDPSSHIIFVLNEYDYGKFYLMGGGTTKNQYIKKDNAGWPRIVTE